MAVTYDEPKFETTNKDEEYIPSYQWGFSGSTVQTYQNQRFRRLPLYIDDLTYGLRADLYDQMMLDAKIKACIGIMIGGILAGGINIIPWSDEGETPLPYDIEVANFCKAVLEGIENDLLTEVLPDMLSAIAVGNRIAELVFYPIADSPIPGKWVLKNIKVKARNSVAFIVDNFLNIIGIGAVTLPGFISGESGAIFEPDNFLWLSWKPVNSDPRGYSDLRAAYDSWWFKQSLKPEYMKYMTRFASESLTGFTAQNAQKIPVLDGFGKPVLGADGKPTTLDPADLMLKALEQIRNGAAAVFPYGSLVESLKSQGNGEAFTLAFHFFDTQMVESVLYQTAATEAGSTAKGTAQVHQDALSLRFMEGQKVVETMINRLLKLLVKYNYKGAHAPQAKLPGAESQDFAAKGATIAKLDECGFLHPSQYEEIDAWLFPNGIGRRSHDSIEEAIKQWVYGGKVQIRVSGQENTGPYKIPPPPAPVKTGGSSGSSLPKSG